MIPSPVPQMSPERPRPEPDGATDVYISVDVETDGPIPGPYSMLSFAMVVAGRFDGMRFTRPAAYDQVFYRELQPISDSYEVDALKVNGLDRERLRSEGADPVVAMSEAHAWVSQVAAGARPVLVAYPLSFDWSFLYWYFVRFAKEGSPFNHSRCYDIKTAYAAKGRVPVAGAGRASLPSFLRSHRRHTHHAVDDAIEQAEVFANVFEWDGEGIHVEGDRGTTRR